VSRPKDIAIVCLAVSTGLLAFVALRQRVEIQRLADAMQMDNRQAVPSLTVHHGSKRTFAIPPRRGASEATLPTRAALDAEAALPAFALGSEARSQGQRTRRGGALMRLMENPDFVQALGLQRQAMLDARFASLFRQLNLSGEELAAFKRLLVEKENVALDVVTVSESLPDGPLSNDALRASVQAVHAQIEQAIQGSLGNERYAVYRDYERTLAQRATVAQLEQRLSYTDTPLGAQQAEALVRILAEHAPPQPVETPPVLSVLVRAGVPEAVPILPANAGTGRVTEEVIVQSQALLAPSQLDALRELQTEQQAAMRAAELIRQATPLEDISAFPIMPLLQ
jgi:hypothetical protein